MTLLQRIPPLLHACIDSNADLDLGNDNSHLRALRLLNKECSGVAMLGLKSYIVTLGGAVGYAQETNISGVRLLRLARLGSLRLNLTLSGEAVRVWYGCWFTDQSNLARNECDHL